MASTYAAVASGPNQALLNAEPQSAIEVPTGGDAPTAAEFNRFADAMSTSYGAPMQLFSVEPLTGAQTELADTSITNLLAELPVLETQANGANLGLQLADGTQIEFASTARLATFLYSLAVQQMQATTFVTDNYNLDMQWLNTIDQPLLDEGGVYRVVQSAENGNDAGVLVSSPAAEMVLSKRSRGKDPMRSPWVNEYILFCGLRRFFASISSIALVLLLCCNPTPSRGGTAADSQQLSSDGRMTQYEAEQSALAEFLKHNPNSVVKYDIFERLIHIPSPRANLGLSGYFLCGRIEYLFAGKLYGPSRIMFNFSNNKILVLILYDYPERGAHVASSLCTQVEEIERNP